jgi:hypothetical protein
LSQQPIPLSNGVYLQSSFYPLQLVSSFSDGWRFREPMITCPKAAKP